MTRPVLDAFDVQTLADAVKDYEQAQDERTRALYALQVVGILRGIGVLEALRAYVNVMGEHDPNVVHEG